MNGVGTSVGWSRGRERCRDFGNCVGRLSLGCGLIGVGASFGMGILWVDRRLGVGWGMGSGLIGVGALFGLGILWVDRRQGVGRGLGSLG